MLLKELQDVALAVIVGAEDRFADLPAKAGLRGARPRADIRRVAVAPDPVADRERFSVAGRAEKVTELRPFRRSVQETRDLFVV